jgi:hypothetical protein
MVRSGGLVKSRSSKAVALASCLAVAAFGLGACGSEDEPEPAEPPPPPLSVATANKLASMSERIASDLDAGDTCTAAAGADELADAIESARIDGTLRPGVEEVATDLVNQVNCPPPPEPEKKKDEKKKGGDDQGEGYEDAQLPGVDALPPGQQKKIEDLAD